MYSLLLARIVGISWNPKAIKEDVKIAKWMIFTVKFWLYKSSFPNWHYLPLDVLLPEANGLGNPTRDVLRHQEDNPKGRGGECGESILSASTVLFKHAHSIISWTTKRQSKQFEKCISWHCKHIPGLHTTLLQHFPAKSNKTRPFHIVLSNSNAYI